MSSTFILGSIALLLVIAAAGIDGAPSVQSHTITQRDHKSRVFHLTSSKGPNVRFKVIDKPRSTRGSPNEGKPPGHLSAASGWKQRTVGPTRWVHTSKQLYVDNSEMKYNAQALLKKDIFPRSGDHVGEWLSQHGEHNWVTLEIPSLHDVTSLDIFETFNPGGIMEVTLLSKHSNRKVVYRRGWNNAVNSRQSSGASMMRIAVSNVPFDVSFVKIVVDASEKWRGIDYFQVTGSVQEDTHIPGTLANNVLTFHPNGKKQYGCDEFHYAANDGTGWSGHGKIKVCYEAPRHNNQLCSNRGTVNQAHCKCPVGWGGNACQIPLCPSANGRMCNGHGGCNAGNCACHGGWYGRACTVRGTSRYCYACNDPHYRSFWGRRFDLYSTGEWVLHFSPPAGGQNVLQVSHYVYHLFVDGSSVRYGHDIATWKWRNTGAGHGGLWVNCRRVGSGWHHTASGMRAYLTGGRMDVHIGSWFRYWMHTGCFGLTTLVHSGTHGMCNDRGWWHVPGSCRLFTCRRCGPDRLLSMIASNKEKITSIAKSGAGKMSKYPLKLSTKLADHIIPMPSENEMGGSDTPTGSTPRERTISLVAEGKKKGVVGQKLRGSQRNPGGKASPAENYIVNMMSVYAMDAGRDGKVDKQKLNEAITNCDPDILHRTMHLDSCLKFIGSGAFDDCVMDACLLAKNLKLNPKNAVKEANKENVVAEEAQEEERREIKTQREALKEADKEDLEQK